jgi:hypothetical protein
VVAAWIGVECRTVDACKNEGFLHVFVALLKQLPAQQKQSK